MFALHETTRKWICRTAFFALCVAPTLATAAWVAGHRLPGRDARTAGEWSDRFGVQIELAGLAEPRPRMVRSRQAKISDSASGRLLAEAAALESRCDSGAKRLSAEHLAVDDAQLACLAAILNSWLAKAPAATHEIAIGKLSFKSAASPRDFTLHDVRGRIERNPAGRIGVRLAAQAPDERSAAKAIRLTVDPSPNNQVPSPTITLDTQSAAIPARLFAVIGPLSDVGHDATFTGVAVWTPGDGAIHGSAQGTLANADLAKFLPTGSPHALRGAATIELTAVSWRGERIERLAGTIHAENAQASHSLVEAAVKHFWCVPPSGGLPAGDDRAMIALELLAIRFALDSQGLTFWGACPPDATAPPGCIAMSGREPLLIQPPYRDFHLGVLVQALTAPSAASFPASREALELANRLPLPTVPQTSR